MELTVYKTSGEETAKKVVLEDTVFGVEPNDHAIYLDVKQYLANARQGTHKSKQRNEVAGSTRKLKRQKGTGGARSGSILSPLFPGGGRVFGPVPRDYSFKLNKKLKRLARRSALSYKMKDEAIKVVEDFAIEAPRTKTIVAMMNAEALLDVKVAYGTVVQELKDVSKSYKEAKMALDVGKIFYAEKKVIAYSTLGIGRLIYQLPVNLCKIFIEEIFGDNVPMDLDEETLNTLNKFFENNLNVSETSRQLFVHRNTLVYRIEKIQKSTGLDLRSFDDALTFKIALMVVNYMKYLDNQEY